MEPSQQPVLLIDTARRQPEEGFSASTTERFLPPGDKRESVIAFAAGALLTPIVWALTSYFLHAPMKPAPGVPKRMETIDASVGTVSKTVRSFGRLSITHYADVGTQISGQVKNVYVTIGETVKAGKLLAEIAPAPQNERKDSNRAQLARLKAELTDQSAQAEFMRLQFERQTKLIADSATRAEDVEMSKMNMLSSAAKVEAINAQIQQVQATMEQDEKMHQETRVTSPINGVVIALATHNGQMINASQTTLMRIAELDTMTVEARVAEGDVTQLHKGMSVSFATPGLPGRRWNGKVAQIMPLPIEDNAQQGKPTFYQVLFDVPNADHALMSGMNAEVDFLLDAVEKAVIIPTCVLEQPKSAGVQTVNVMDATGKLHLRKITLGLMNDQTAQVTAGLRAGEKVVALDQNVMPDCVRIANSDTGK